MLKLGSPLHKALIDLRSTYDRLLADVENAKGLDLDHNESGFIKRTYTRAFFALVEGVAFRLKQIALATNEESSVFEAYEVELLREQEGYLTQNGQPRQRNARLSLLPNFLFALTAVSRAFNLDVTPDSSGEGYQAFNQAIKIRDRITHPKHAESIEISDEEMMILGKANAWFRDHVKCVIDKLAEECRPNQLPRPS